MTEVVHSGQDCGPPPIGHGLYGRDSSSHRERDGGSTGHSGCKCRWEEKGGSAFFEFGKEIEDFFSMSTLGTRLARADDMLLLPSALTYEAGLPTEAWILGFWADAVPVISGTCMDSVCSFSL